MNEKGNARPIFVDDVQAASMIGLHPQTLRNYRNMRKGPPYTKMGRAVRYSVRDLLIWAGRGLIVPELQ